jgi:hypothetical protein
MAQVELTVRTLARNGWVVAGLLLLAIGLGDLVVGRTKLAQYHDVLEQVPAVHTRDRSVLFPKASETDEQRNVARAKLGYYNILFLAGQMLTLGGLILVVIGLVRLRLTSNFPLVPARSR